MNKWNESRSRIPAERPQATDQRVAAALKELPPHRLREARRLTQKQIAEAMHIDQRRVSKIERPTDVYVSTLRNFVSAMGVELELGDAASEHCRREVIVGRRPHEVVAVATELEDPTKVPANADVSRIAVQFDPRITIREVGADFIGAIGRSIVRNDDPEVPPSLPCPGGERI